MPKIKDVYEEIEKEKENDVDDKTISMSEEDFISEHKNLIKVLRSGDPKALEAEAKKQEEELKEKIGLFESDDTAEDD